MNFCSNSRREESSISLGSIRINDTGVSYCFMSAVVALSSFLVVDVDVVGLEDTRLPVLGDFLW